MAKRRWIQDRHTGELIEVTADYQQEHRGPSLDSALWGDRGYQGLQSPDGTDISSRSKHRAYLKASGLATTDDFRGSWDKAQERRDHYRQNGGSVSSNDVRRAIERLTQR
jgi:hypothetical protein